MISTANNIEYHALVSSVHIRSEVIDASDRNNKLNMLYNFRLKFQGKKIFYQQIRVD